MLLGHFLGISSVYEYFQHFLLVLVNFSPVKEKLFLTIHLTFGLWSAIFRNYFVVFFKKWLCFPRWCRDWDLGRTQIPLLLLIEKNFEYIVRYSCCWISSGRLCPSSLPGWDHSPGLFPMSLSLFGFSLTSLPLFYVAKVKAYKFSVEVVALDPVSVSPFNRPGHVELQQSLMLL